MNLAPKLGLTLAALAAFGLAGVRPAAAAVTLVDDYNFNGAGSTVVDSVNAANDGTLTNGATQANGSLTPGTANGGGYVALPSYTFAPNTAYSFETFYTPPDVQNGVPVLFSYGNDRNNFVLGVSQRFNGPNGGQVPQGAPPVGDLKVAGSESTDYSTVNSTLGVQNQFVVVLDGSTFTEYLNGAQAARFNFAGLPGELGTTTQNAIGGHDEFPDPSFDGTIQNFRIYTGALTATQVAADYAAGPNGVVNGSPAPEPSQIGMLALMGLGLGGLMLRARKRSFVAA